MFFSNINYWVVVAATVAGMVVGFVWYAPWAFGKLWIRSKGWSDEEIARKQALKKSMWKQFSAMTVGTFLTAFALAALFHSLVVVSMGGMLVVALTVWLGFSVPLKLGDYLFGGDTLAAFLLSIGQERGASALMSLIVGIFG